MKRVIRALVNVEAERPLQLLEAVNHWKHTACESAVELGVDSQNRRCQAVERVHRRRRSPVEGNCGRQGIDIQRQVPAVAAPGAKPHGAQLVAPDEVVQALKIANGALHVRQPPFGCGLLIQRESLYRVVRRATEAREQVDADSDKPGSCRAAGHIADVVVQPSVLVAHQDPGQRLSVTRAGLVRENRARFARKFDLGNHLQVLGVLGDLHVCRAPAQLLVVVCVRLHSH